MTKQKLYTFLGLYVGPVIGFFGVLYLGVSLFKAPLIVVVVFAGLFAAYEFYIMRVILRRVDWDA